MAKMAKLPQTDWTRGGHDISQTSIPLYQESLTNMGNILRDQDAARQKYIKQYYDANNPIYSDFMTAYKRNMAAQTANNWNATHGGYTTSGQRSYEDNQRYMNDLASRLNQYGITGATTLVNSDLANLMNSAGVYQNAYNLGKNYSAIETQNFLADEYNNNWWANALGAFGEANMQAAQYVPGPWKAIPYAVGGTALTASNMFGKDFSGANSAYGAIYGGNPLGGNNSYSGFTNMNNAMNNMGVNTGQGMGNMWNSIIGMFGGGSGGSGAGQNVGFAFPGK